MPELSIIVPFVNEYPQLIFTLQSINQELAHRWDPVDFEVIAVNNYCDEVIRQDRDQSRWLSRQLKNRFKIEDDYAAICNWFDAMEVGIGNEDQGGKVLQACAGGNKWLRVIDYKDKLSHWNAKRVGVESSDSRHLLFIDAHCIAGRDSIFPQFNYYKNNFHSLNGTLHLPLTYKILEWHRLIYALRFIRNREKVQLDYRFATYRQEDKPYEVPCMSTCGMMISRELYEEVGGWPSELGIYSGGEHFMNFTLAIMDKKKWIMPIKTALYHHGEKRGYAFNSFDTLRNRCIAAYLYGGQDWFEEHVVKSGGRPNKKDELLRTIPDLCKDQRDHIKARAKMTILQWLKKWGYDNETK